MDIYSNGQQYQVKHGSKSKFANFEWERRDTHMLLLELVDSRLLMHFF